MFALILNAGVEVELDFDVAYTYQLDEGMVNIHLALWFVDKDDPNDAPFLEVMVKIKNQDHNDCRPEWSYGSFKVMGETWRYCFKKSGWSQGAHDHLGKNFDTIGG